jgi:hypothetical protein
MSKFTEEHYIPEDIATQINEIELYNTYNEWSADWLYRVYDSRFI